MNRLSLKDRAKILSCLVEGNSMRATSRMVGVSINTVVKLLVDLGIACSDYQDKVFQKLPCKRVQVDEIWSFCYAKAKNVSNDKRGILGYGDVFTWVGLDADTKLVPSWLVGQRDAEYANMFIGDLASRLANRIQLTSDGHRAYLYAVESAFGSNIDYSMLVKLYGTPQGKEEARRYSPGECCGAIKGAVCGNPNEKHVSTSFIERQNLTMRMSMRRFTRLTNGFSKKIENHEYAVAIHYMYYNFGRIHKTLRVTPAMEAGIADHVWTLEEIANLAN
ncbi:MAG TPA: IS1 family transposase [Burkholderiales bacterium]|nr:IS1 family transposase [Burkholderiales bacterium]